MFSIKSVEVTNFMSFRGTHTWVLPDDSGLYFLTGRNDQKPSLGRNGVGKTSLLNAILWCLYGKTNKRARAGTVINRGCNSGAGCTVRLAVNGTELTVTRTQSPNSLTLNGEKVDQEALTKALVFNYESFCYAVLIPQGKLMFFELSPGEKLTLFSAIKGLDEWLVYADKALERSKALTTEKGQVQVKLAVLGDRIAGIENTIEGLKVKSTEWADTQAAEINRQFKFKQECQIKVLECRSEAALLDASIKVLKRNTAENESTLKGYEAQARELLDQINVVKHEVVAIQTKVKAHNKALNRLQRLGPVCPECDQKVDNAHIQSHLKKIENELKVDIADLAELEELEKAAVAETETFHKKVSALSAVIARDKRSILDEERQRDTYLSDVKYHENMIKRTDEYIAQAQAQTNEFDGMIRKRQADLIQAKGEHNKLEMAAIALNEQLEAANYWVGGFKRIRLLVIEETLQTLEMEVNNNLTALGLGDWRIEFDIERENKSGGFTKGFTVLIWEPDHDEPIEWETFSAGETQLLKLAGSLGLANLICEQAGLVNTVEFYDEASDHLSQAPVNALCEVLRDRAEQAKRQIWMVDHSAIEYGDFTGTLTVIKGDEGSHITKA